MRKQQQGMDIYTATTEAKHQTDNAKQPPPPPSSEPFPRSVPLPPSPFPRSVPSPSSGIHTEKEIFSLQKNKYGRRISFVNIRVSLRFFFFRSRAGWWFRLGRRSAGRDCARPGNCMKVDVPPLIQNINPMQNPGYLSYHHHPTSPPPMSHSTHNAAPHTPPAPHAAPSSPPRRPDAAHAHARS